MHDCVMSALLLLAWVAGSASGSEMPSYHLVSSNPPFEVRDYPENLAIEVDVSGERADAEARGIALISAYLATGLHISAKKAANAVFPAAEIEGSLGWTIHVPLPPALTHPGDRPPMGERLRIVKTPGQRLLAVVMSGGASTADFEAARGRLFAFGRENHLTLQTPSWIVVYAPPATPWFLQRKEVLAPITAVSAK